MNGSGPPKKRKIEEELPELESQGVGRGTASDIQSKSGGGS